MPCVAFPMQNRERAIALQDAGRLCLERARPYRLRKNSILPSVLKGHGFSRADMVNQISVGFRHRGTYFRIIGEIQPFSAACSAAPKLAKEGD